MGVVWAQQGGADMTQYWEYLVIILSLVLLLAGLIFVAWLQDYRRWKDVAPYYGRTYDASDSRTYRPNIDLRRTR